MAVLEILRFPDPKLRKRCAEVSSVTPDLVQLAEDMLETMYNKRGIGLAAAQVNRQVRLLVCDTRPRESSRYELEGMSELEQKVEQPFVIFNPVIVKREGKTTFEEGCLSVPGYYETVERSNYIEVEGLNIKGEKFLTKVDGLLAIVIQHEMDHLDGKLFIDRLSIIKATRLKSKIKKLGYPDPSATQKENKETAL